MKKLEFDVTLTMDLQSTYKLLKLLNLKAVHPPGPREHEKIPEAAAHASAFSAVDPSMEQLKRRRAYEKDQAYLLR